MNNIDHSDIVIMMCLITAFLFVLTYVNWYLHREELKLDEYEGEPKNYKGHAILSFTGAVISLVCTIIIL